MRYANQYQQYLPMTGVRRPAGAPAPARRARAQPRVQRPIEEAPPRVRSWVRRVLEIRPAIERAIGYPVRRMLGCGHFGCAFESDPPWVVKLTIDPDEGPIWHRVLQVFGEQGGSDGFVRVARLVDLRPGVMYGGRRRRTYAIVREAIEPMLIMPRRRDMRLGTGPQLTRRTKRELGLNEDLQVGLFRSVEGLAKRLPGGGVETLETHEARQFETFLQSLQEYRRAASYYHQGAVPLGFAQARVYDALQVMGSTYFGESLADSLGTLVRERVLLRDLHFLNVGWRVSEDAPGFAPAPVNQIIAFDPGFTPTERGVPIEQVRIENPAACYAENIAWWGEVR